MFSKGRLIKILSAELTGYELVPGATLGAAALLFKQVDDLILTLAIELSTRYSGRFTGSFYLSKSFTWAYVPTWFPRRAYSRIGHFLGADDRAETLDLEFRKDSVVDAWWWAEANGVAKFVDAVHRAEPRFLNDPLLLSQLRDNEGLEAHLALLDDVANEARRRRPASTEAPLPQEWLDAAADILHRRDRQHPKPALVKLIAIDAWRREVLCGDAGVRPRKYT